MGLSGVFATGQDNILVNRYIIFLIINANAMSYCTGFATNDHDCNFPYRNRSNVYKSAITDRLEIFFFEI